MEALQSQNKLLKDYVKTLEKENDARNIERTTLFKEIDRMTQEINRLNELLSKSNASNSRVVVTSSSSSDKQVQILKESNASLVKQIESLRTTNSQLSSDLRTKTNEMIVLKQQQQRLTLQIKTLKQSQTQSASTNNRIILLQSELNSTKIKLSQITTLEQTIKISSTRITELETANRKYESDYKRIESQLRRQENQVKRLQSENKELKISTKSSSQISALLNSKLTLQASIRQLNAKIEWLEGNNKHSEQEKTALEKRIKDLEKEVLESKGKLTQFRFNQQSLKSFEASLSIKDKEMEALEQMIGSLKENKKYLQKSLKEKEDTIAILQARQSQSRVNYKDQYQKQIIQLTESKNQLERQLTLQISSNQEKEGELRMLRGERQLMQRDFAMLANSLEEARKQISLLKGKLAEHSNVHHEPYFKPLPIPSRNEDDIRLVVSDLRSQIQELKASQSQQHFKSQVIQSNVHRCETCHHTHLKDHQQRRSKSPQKTAHSKIINTNNQRDKGPFNQQKWQNLQRKIIALRSQNQALKKSLFD